MRIRTTVFAIVGLGLALLALFFVRQLLAPAAFVRFVFPDGYRGPVKLVLDPESGTPWVREGNSVIIRVPDNGTMRVIDFSPFKSWHEEEVWYPTGYRIPITPAYVVAKETIALRSLGTLSGSEANDSTTLYYLGTEAEAMAYDSKLMEAQIAK